MQTPKIFLKTAATILLIYLCFGTSISAQNRCFIKTNPQECANCILGGKISLEKIDTSLVPTFVFEEIYADQVPRFFKDILQISWKKEQIIISDSIFNLLNTSAVSEVHVLNENGEQLFKSNFKDLQLNLDKINAYRPSSKNILIDLPDSIIFSRTIKVLNGIKYFLIHDYQFNDIYFVNKNAITVHIKATDIDLKSLMNHYFGRDFEYDLIQHNLPTMKKMGKDKIKFEIAWNNADTFYMLLNIPHLIIEKKNDKNNAIIDQVYVITSWVDGKMVATYPVIHLEHKKYQIDQGNYFFLRNNQFYLSVFKEGLKGSNLFLGIFDIQKDNKVVFNRFQKSTLPKMYKEVNWDYVNVDFTRRADFLFFNYANNVINIANNKCYKLPFNPLYKKVGDELVLLYTLYDIIDQESSYTALYSYDNLFQVAKINKEDFSVLENKNISFIDIKKYKSNFILTAQNQAIVIDNSNNIMLINLN